MEVQELKEQIAGISCSFELTDSILSLLDSPDSPYILKSEAEKRIKKGVLTPKEIHDITGFTGLDIKDSTDHDLHMALKVSRVTIQKAVELFEVKK
jgi:hypothetical protein